jgi:hypothetical protein
VPWIGDSLITKYMNEPKITEFTAHLEHDLMEAKELLRAGLEVSLEHLRRAGDAASAAALGSARQKLIVLESHSEEALAKIEECVAELVDLTSEKDIDNADDFERWANELSDSLHEARSALAEIDEEGQRDLGNEGGAVKKAWRDLHLYIEMVRLELALAASATVHEADALRQELMDEFQNAADDALNEKKKEDEESGYVGRLLDKERIAFSEIASDLKRFFMSKR